MVRAHSCVQRLSRSCKDEPGIVPKPLGGFWFLLSCNDTVSNQRPSKTLVG